MHDQPDPRRSSASEPQATAAANPFLIEVPSIVAGFRCSACGDCCRGWSIPVDQEFLSGLEDRLAVGGAAADLDTFVQAPATDSVQHQPVLRSAGGRCLFLTAGNRCSLHARAGGGAKPAACRSYPYRQVRLASRVGLSLDFSCRAAATLLDRPFPPESAARVQHAALAAAPPTELIAGLGLPSQIFFELEGALLAAIELRGVALDERLLTASLLLDEVLADLDENPGDPPARRAWRLELQQQPEAQLRRLRRRARGLPAAPQRQYLLLGRLFDLVEQWLLQQDATPAPFWAETRRVRERFDIDAQASGWDERAPAFNEALAEIWSRRTPGAERVLSNYLWHETRARRLSAVHGLLGGFRILVIRYVMARLHAAGLADLAGETPGARHAVRAVQLVERNFGHLPPLGRFWRRTTPINLLADPGLVPGVLLLRSPGEAGEARRDGEAGRRSTADREVA